MKTIMKTLKNILLITLVIPCICATVLINNTYTLSKDYTVTINGTSNLHNWNETVGIVSGEGAVNNNTDGTFDLTALTIKMEVHSIKSDMGSVMNNNTYKALKADNNPEITFTLIDPLATIKSGTMANTLSAKGNLTIAGVTKPVTMQVKIIMEAPGKMAFEGTQTIQMTDYGINPPTALFGTLKTGNTITISFKTNFTQTNN
jgi:polyisoprenoid-binding protein YceI